MHDSCQCVTVELIDAEGLVSLVYLTPPALRMFQMGKTRMTQAGLNTQVKPRCVCARACACLLYSSLWDVEALECSVSPICLPDRHVETHLYRLNSPQEGGICLCLKHRFSLWPLQLCYSMHGKNGYTYIPLGMGAFIHVKEFRQPTVFPHE
jgi:hypothetical protein